MIVVGAKGFAKEVLEILHQLNQTENLVFFDNVSNDLPELLFNRFRIIRTEKEVKEHFKKHGNSFILGLGNPKSRKMLCEKLELWGGKVKTIISPTAQIGNYDVTIGEGTVILPNAIIANSTHIGKGCILYYNTMITHDCQLGKFVELSPGATLLGGTFIGDLCHIGANATVLPKVKLGSNITVGAGAVVTKSFISNCILVGVPAREKS
jgi:sugar O-acyltransferase (sialic acid O-acetyltransferase NeuD family)